jgi:hypothetical protein
MGYQYILRLTVDSYDGLTEEMLSYIVENIHLLFKIKK